MWLELSDQPSFRRDAPLLIMAMNVISNSTPSGYTITYVVPFHIWAIPAAAIIVALVAIVGISTVIVRRKRQTSHRVSSDRGRQ